MNAKGKKGVIGITLASIMIASIFAVITPVAAVSLTVDGDRSDWDSAGISELVLDGQDIGGQLNEPCRDWMSGYDIRRLFGHYDQGTDTWYFMISAIGLIGDSDGDLNTDTATPFTGPNCTGVTVTAYNSSDEPGVGPNEYYEIHLDPNEDDVYEVILRYNNNVVTSAGSVVIPSGKLDAAWGEVVEFCLEDASDYLGDDPCQIAVRGFADYQYDYRDEDFTDAVSEPCPHLEFDFGVEYICCRNFEFTGTSEWDGSPIANHTWDFGDGETLGPRSGEPEDYDPVEHQYPASYAGRTVTVTLSGFNEVAKPNSTQEFVYIPKNPTAKADANPLMIAPGDTVTFDGSGSSADVGSIVSWDWEIEGNTYHEAVDLPAPDNDGIVEVAVMNPPTTATLTVSDDHCTGDASVTIQTTSKCKIRVYGTLDFGAGNICPKQGPDGMSAADYGPCEEGDELCRCRICPENPPYTDAIAPFRANSLPWWWWMFEDSDATDVEEFLDSGISKEALEGEVSEEELESFRHFRDEIPRKDYITFNPIKMAHSDRDWDNAGDPTDSVYARSIKAGQAGAGIADADEKEFFRMWYEPTEWIKDEDADGCLGLVLDGPEGELEVVDLCPRRYPHGEGWEELHDLLSEGYMIRKSNDNSPYKVVDDDDDVADIYAPSIKQEFTFMFLDTWNDPITASTGISKFLVPMASRDEDNGIDSFDAKGDGGDPDFVWVCSEDNLGDVNSDGIPDQLDIDGDGKGWTGFETLSEDGWKLSGDETLVLRTDTQTIHKNERIQFFDFEIELKDTNDGRATLNVYYKGNPDSWGDEWIGQVDLGADLLPTLGSSVATFERGGVNTHISPRGPGFVWVTDVDNEDGYAQIIVGRMFGETWANIGKMHDDGEVAWSYQKHFYVDGVLYNVVAILTEGDEDFKYVTFRVKLPKVPLWIENHSNELIGWELVDDECILPVMPQFNMDHTILLDVQREWTDEKKGDKADVPELVISYVAETIEPRFHGELREILGEPGDYPWRYGEEGWWIEWFQTIPYEYTAFKLPEGHGLYLITSAFRAPEAGYHYWDGGELLDAGTSSRLKFWYDPADNTDIYVNRMGEMPEPPVLAEYYDSPAGYGDGDSKIDLKELLNAITDYLDKKSPFGPGGYGKRDLIGYIKDFIKQEGF